MLRKGELLGTVSLLATVIAAIVIYSFYFANSIFYIDVVLISLAIFSAFVLTELFINWLIILSFVLAVIILFTGVVYLPTNQYVLLIMTFPIILGLASKISRYLRKHKSRVEDKRGTAESYYSRCLASLSEGRIDQFQVLLIHWAHYHHFQQMNPKGTGQMLDQIDTELKKHLQTGDHLYYIADGHFLLINREEDRDDLTTCFDQVLLEALSKLYFENADNAQEVQYQKGYLLIDSSNSQKFEEFDQLIKNLERQLETDIIVEY